MDTIETMSNDLLYMLRNRYCKIMHADDFDPDEDITYEEVVDLWRAQKGLCALTGLQMTYGAPDMGTVTLNRKNRRGSYSLVNMQLVCAWVDRAKMCDDHEFRRLLLSLQENKRLTAHKLDPVVVDVDFAFLNDIYEWAVDQFWCHNVSLFLNTNQSLRIAHDMTTELFIDIAASGVVTVIQKHFHSSHADETIFKTELADPNSVSNIKDVLGAKLSDIIANYPCVDDLYGAKQSGLTEV